MKKPNKEDMEKLWERVRKTVVDGMSVAAEKTEEVTKLGKAKIDILTTKRKITKAYSELGGLTYEAIKVGKTDEVMESDDVKKLIGQLKELEAELDIREEAFENLKKQKSEEKEK